MYIKKNNKYYKINDNIDKSSNEEKKDKIEKNKINDKKEFEVANNVINKLKENGIVPIPENYEKEFELLVTINNEYNEIKEFLRIKELENFKNNIEEEKFILNLIKNNIQILKDLKDLSSFLLKKHMKLSVLLNELDTKEKNIQNYKKAYNEYIKVLNKLLEKIKRDYNKNTLIIKEVKNFKKYDHKYNLYNENYFFNYIKNKKGTLIKINIEINKNLKDTDFVTVVKKIGEKILEQLRKNDIVSFKEEHFYIFLDGVNNKELGKKILSRLEDKIYSLYLIVNGEEIKLNLKSNVEII